MKIEPLQFSLLKLNQFVYLLLGKQEYIRINVLLNLFPVNKLTDTLGPRIGRFRRMF